MAKLPALSLLAAAARFLPVGAEGGHVRRRRLRADVEDDRGDGDAAGLLQMPVAAASAAADSLAVAAAATSSDDKQRWSWAEAGMLFEAFMGHSIADFHIAALVGARGFGVRPPRINRRMWDDLFARLDNDFDGEIGPADLETLSRHKASSEVQRMRMNITEAHCKEAIATLAGWYPKLAPFFVLHGQLVLYHAWTGQPLPEGAPMPKESDFAAVSFLQTDSDAESSEKMIAKLSPCSSAIIQLILQTMHVIFSFLGIVLKGDKWGESVRQTVASDEDLLEQIEGVIDKFGGPSALVDAVPAKLGDLVIEVGKLLWDGNVFRVAFNEALKDMTWWDWIKLSSLAVASLVLFWMTDGTANELIAVISNSINFGLAAKQVGDVCSTSNAMSNATSSATSPWWNLLFGLLDVYIVAALALALCYGGLTSRRTR